MDLFRIAAAEGALAELRHVVEFEIDVVGHEQVQVSVAIVIAP